MIELTHKRILESPNSTAGVLYHGSTFLGFVIEDGFREQKVYGETRIPEGRYKIVKKQYGKFFTKYNLVYHHNWVGHITNVPGFEEILIHIGNTPKDSKGCLLLNGALTYSGGNWIGSSSVDCYRNFYQYIAGKMDDDIFITITNEIK